MIPMDKIQNKHISDGEKGNMHNPLNTPPLYYLHPSNHIGMNFFPVTFKDENYQEWEINMYM